VAGFVCNWLVRPVDARHHATAALRPVAAKG